MKSFKSEGRDGGWGGGGGGRLFARPIPHLSWSPDLEKCMDCSVCQRQNKNDFCSTCGDPQPINSFNLWVLIGASLGAVLLASIIAGTIIYARCRRREKFTTPIEETGGHSAQESLIH
uniref:TNF receptor superfamily member 12A n=1 Tax=Pseudonaja textilis TaxID=8673 RepID=A0A670YLK6_PSETE